MTESASQPITVLVVDDHEIVRMGLRLLLESTSGMEVLGEADTMARAVSEALRLSPGVVLLDVRLPDGSGVDACREIVAARPDTRVIFLTSYDDEEAMLAAVFAGAHGYLLKDIDSDGLVRAVQAVAAGQSTLDPAAARVVMQRLREASGPARSGPRPPALSPQEQRVAALVAEGKTNKEIALALGLSEKTVKNYLSNVFEKLHVSRRSEAAAIVAQQRGR